MAKKKVKKKAQPPVELVDVIADAVEIVKVENDQRPVFVDMGVVVVEPPVGAPEGVCDTCKREGRLMVCPQCGKTYCNKCRTPHQGHYRTCQFCEAGL